MAFPKRLLVAALVAFAACRTPPAPAPGPAPALAPIVCETSDLPELVLGEFPLAKKKPILDGDTIRVDGLDSTMRLLGVDTEETFKHRKEQIAFEKGWESYLAEMRGNSKHPVKMATPAGMEALAFATAFFDGSPTVRLERDHPGEIRDFYGRWLAYVFAKKDGRWVNYNVEVVRAGWSPYFVKYGRSRRFHAAFVAAQDEARAAKRGIWGDAVQHYPDYPERLKWWGARDAVVQQFEEKAEGKADHVALTRADSIDRLTALVGKPAVVFGLVGDIVTAKSGPTIVKLAKDRTHAFEVVFFDAPVLEASGIRAQAREYVEVRGTIADYQGKPQIVVREASQVKTFVTGGAGDDEGAGEESGE